MTLGGVVLVIAGTLAIWRLARCSPPYRAGPWPGLTPRGAGVLLGCALVLAGGQFGLGMPAQPVPDVPLMALLVFAPLALAVRLTRIPGAASAVCGAYLLPRTLLSVVEPGLEPPPLLLVPALVFDMSLWLRAGDLRNLWPARRNPWRKRDRAVPRPGLLRAASAGGLFGLTLAALEPPFVGLLGADPAKWSGADTVVAAAACAVCCALLGLSVPGKGS
ncbi:MAG: hypothetical protein LC797_06235 [Chloroflexi bacterium]|nr:hypothetical protein [Chloroflexota bacterium]